MDLRFDVWRAGCFGVSRHVVRFRGSLLAADEDLAVYLTPTATLVFYAKPRHPGPGQCWHFANLEEAAAARHGDGRYALPARPARGGAAQLRDDRAPV